VRREVAKEKKWLRSEPAHPLLDTSLPQYADSLKRFLQLLLAFMACLQICGGPLGFMQGVAWVGMTISYSSDEGIVEGVKKTFDGAHPCRLCCAIKAVRKTESEHPVKPSTAPEHKLGKILTDLSFAELGSLPPVLRHGLCQATQLEIANGTGIGPFAPALPPPRAA
jgi:hypothetical protein